MVDDTSEPEVSCVLDIAKKYNQSLQVVSFRSCSRGAIYACSRILCSWEGCVWWVEFKARACKLSISFLVHVSLIA